MQTSDHLFLQTENFVRFELQSAEGGHDWQHIQRVLRNARIIASKEDCQEDIVIIGALLHDIADSKFYGGDEEIGPRKATAFLEAQGADPGLTRHVEQIIRNISFKSREKKTFSSIELDIVQDADRLDAMGAVGIARAFNYGGFKNRLIFDPEITPVIYPDKEAYKNSTAPTINHFYEKLLLLKDLMNTHTGKQMAAERHQFMEIYLAEFFQEVGLPAFQLP